MSMEALTALRDIRTYVIEVAEMISEVRLDLQGCQQPQRLYENN